MMPEMPDDAGAGGRRPGAHRRHTLPAGRVLIVMLVCLLTWTLLYAPAWTGAGTKSCPSVYIGTIGAIWAVSP